MKLTPTTFYAAFPDGLLLMKGHEFEYEGRMYVVHKKRQPYCEWDKDYGVSDKELGFRVPCAGRTKQEAVTNAIACLKSFSAENLANAHHKAENQRKNLKVI